MAPHDEKKDRGLNEAKQKLNEVRGRPIDVDVVLSSNRAKEERQRRAAKEAQHRLEKVLEDARARRHTIREQALETENMRLVEKQQRAEGWEQKRPEQHEKKPPREKTAPEE